ncbi:MAG: extracellular solute-binding protein [Hyphomicrobiaceae bacterium]|nr:MAG: extracellular solute-binding protein [Hyphomicrobiaceae bacterium]
MADKLSSKCEISRRLVIETMAKAAGVGALISLPGVCAAQAQTSGPWSQAPKGKVDKVNFVVWTYGDIYTRISKQFEADWGTKVESTISSFNDHPTKLATMFAAGEKIDVSQSSPFSFPNFVDQGLAEPIDGLPGAADYIKDFTGFTKQVTQFGGKTMGLPYFSAIWVWNYYTELLEKAKIDKPFATYDELIEHCVKAKKDGIARYPILWIAGVGLEQLPGTWYSITCNRGGTFFDKQGNHMLGPGSIAREVLKWWANTYEKGLDIADPESLKVQFTSSAKAFGAGKNLYRGPNHHYGLNIVNDPAQSPIAGKVKVHGWPGDGKTIGVTHVYFLSSANRDKEWAWKLLQYLGGRTKDGEYTQAVGLARDAMLGSGYQSVMQSDSVKKGWAPWGDVDAILGMWDKASYIGEICSSVYKPWHFPWSDQINIEVQKCLTGQITADACCDNLIKGIDEAKKKV